MRVKTFSGAVSLQARSWADGDDLNVNTFSGDVSLRLPDNARGRIAYLLLYWPVHAVGLCLMWTISRYREYAADRGAAAITGAPEQLMSALAKIAEREPRGDLRGGAAVSALCIVPAQRKSRLDVVRRLEIFMDHPPLDKRLRRLNDLARDLGKAA